MPNQTVNTDKTVTPHVIVQGTAADDPIAGATGAIDDTAYSDATGAADGTVISLLKGIFVQLAIIAENTTPAA